MQEHNRSLIPIIVADDSRKIERNKDSRNLKATSGSDGRRLAEVPMMLFHSGSLILNKPPTTLITVANNKVILVKVQLHTLNELITNPILDMNECFCA